MILNFVELYLLQGYSVGNQIELAPHLLDIKLELPAFPVEDILEAFD